MMNKLIITIEVYNEAFLDKKTKMASREGSGTKKNLSFD